MKSSQPQNLSVEAGSTADVQEINTLKTLENPAHRGAVGRFVDLIGKGLFRCHQLATQQMFGQPIHQQAEHHQETQSNQALWLLDEDRGSQKQGIFEKTKPTLHASLLFIGGDHLFMRKSLHVQDVGGYDEGRFLDTLWPRSPNGPVFPFGTPLLETLF